MNTDFRFALYVFCSDYHSGQWSRLYRLRCRINAILRDDHIHAIRGDRERVSQACWDEWETARGYYHELEQSKYATEAK